jgi:hypothetical protein
MACKSALIANKKSAILPVVSSENSSLFTTEEATRITRPIQTSITSSKSSYKIRFKVDKSQGLPRNFR